MIKIQDTLWTVTPEKRAPLAYMCQVVKKQDGTPDSATEKMMGTGRGWAGSKSTESFHENVPTKGFVLGDSVSRWSTENKLFRVLDPRGFEVEVPTGNISAVLKHCTVIKGVVQEECVWGREGGSHLLLPVNSEPYTEARKVIQKIETGLIKPVDLVPGDRVVWLTQGRQVERVFLGLVKLSWLRKSSDNFYKQGSGWGYYNHYTELVSSTPLDEQVIKDDKWVALLAYQSTWENYRLNGPEREASRRELWRWSAEMNPKILSRTPGDMPVEVTLDYLNDEGHYLCVPDRVKKQFQHQSNKYGDQRAPRRLVCEDSIAAIEIKGEK